MLQVFRHHHRKTRPTLGGIMAVDAGGTEKYLNVRGQSQVVKNRDQAERRPHHEQSAEAHGLKEEALEGGHRLSESSKLDDHTGVARPFGARRWSHRRRWCRRTRYR